MKKICHFLVTSYKLRVTKGILPSAFCLLLFAFCIFSAWAQNSFPTDEYQYVPIPNNHIWSVNVMKFKTQGDTVINNKEYLKVYQQYNNAPYEFDMSKAKYYCALRNDTLNKKVYVVYPDKMNVYNHGYNETPIFITTDTTELLLYDFSLNVGDTVSIYEFNEMDIYKLKMKRVEDVWLFEDLTYTNTDSMQLLENGSYRRRILMNLYDTWHAGYNTITAWIEGIGSIHGLTRHFLDNLVICDAGFWNLLCYENENELLLSTPWNINNNCFRYGVRVKIKENSKNIDIDVYPNPATDYLKIKNIEELNLSNYEIEIFDVYGRNIYSSTCPLVHSNRYFPFKSGILFYKNS